MTRRPRKTDSSVVVSLAQVQKMIRDGERKRARPVAQPVTVGASVNQDEIERLPSHTEIAASREARWRDEGDAPHVGVPVAPRRAWPWIAALVATLASLAAVLAWFVRSPDPVGSSSGPDQSASSSAMPVSPTAVITPARSDGPSVPPPAAAVPVATATSSTDAPATDARDAPSIPAKAQPPKAKAKPRKRTKRVRKKRRRSTRTDHKLDSLIDSL